MPEDVTHAEGEQVSLQPLDVVAGISNHIQALVWNSFGVSKYLIGCELLLMKEGYLFWCYIYGKKWKSNFIMNISMLQGMQS